MSDELRDGNTLTASCFIDFRNAVFFLVSLDKRRLQLEGV
jgi:hypothetical protein